MKSGLALLIGASLSLSVFTSRPADAADRSGGLPDLTTRVEGLEVEVPQLDARVGDLELTVEEQGDAGAELDDRVATLETRLGTVQNQLFALVQNALLFAVVDGDATIRESRGVQSVSQPVDGDGNPLTGHYHVVFTRDVSQCAVTVTAEPSFSSGIVASVNGTFRGSPIHDPNRVVVVLSDEDNDRINTRFNIIVMC